MKIYMYIQGLLLLYIPFKVNIIKIENIVHIDIDYSQFFKNIICIHSKLYRSNSWDCADLKDDSHHAIVLRYFACQKIYVERKY